MAKYVEFYLECAVGSDTKIFKYNNLPEEAELDEIGRELYINFIDDMLFFEDEEELEEDLETTGFYSYMILDSIDENDDYEEMD